MIFFSIIILLDFYNSSFVFCVLLVSYHKYSRYFSDNRKATNDSVVSTIMPMTHEIDTLAIILSIITAPGQTVSVICVLLLVNLDKHQLLISVLYCFLFKCHI